MKVRKRHIGFIVPAHTGNRTLLKTMYSYVQNQYHCQTTVLDARDFEREELKKEIERRFGLARTDRPDHIILSHYDFFTGLYRLLHGVPTSVIVDHPFFRAKNTDRKHYRKLTEKEFIERDRKREEMKRQLPLEGTDEQILFGLKRHIESDPSMPQLLKALGKKIGDRDFGVPEYRDYLINRHGIGYVRALAEQVQGEFVVNDLNYSILRYNELAHIKSALFWARMHLPISKRHFPEFNSKYHRILPFLEVPKTVTEPRIKLREKRLLAVGTTVFNEHGEVAALKLLQLLPKKYTLDIVGTTKERFETGLDTLADRKILMALLSRVRFHFQITDQVYQSLLHQAFLTLKLRAQGWNSMAICEALAFGIPAVCIKFRMDDDILIHQKNGFLIDSFPPSADDLEKIKNFILSFENKPEKYSRLSREARRIGEKLDVSIWTPRILRWAGLRLSPDFKRAK